MRRIIAFTLFALLMGPLTGSLTHVDGQDRGDWVSYDGYGVVWMPYESTTDVPNQINPVWIEDSTPWWERTCLLYTSPSPRDMRRSRMPSSA